MIAQALAATPGEMARQGEADLAVMPIPLFPQPGLLCSLWMQIFPVFCLYVHQLRAVVTRNCTDLLRARLFNSSQWQTAERLGGSQAVNEWKGSGARKRNKMIESEVTAGMHDPKTPT